MKQKEIISYYKENGGLRCKGWTVNEIKKFIKNEFGKSQKVYESTCLTLKRMAEINQM